MIFLEGTSVADFPVCKGHLKRYLKGASRRVRSLWPDAIKIGKGRMRQEMIRVKIELWLWLGRELGGDFISSSEMRSEMVIDLPDATTVLAMFDRLADRYPVFGVKVFDRKNRKVYKNLLVTHNDRAFNLEDSYDRVLQDGDKVMVMPLYAGG